MPAFRFAFPRQPFFRHGFSARKPRHRWLRATLGLLGLGVLLVLVFFSAIVGLAMIAAGLLYRLWRQRGQPLARSQRVVDGEFRVVRKAALPSG